MNENDTPTVSVGLPVYNGENFLTNALDSLLAQTYTDFELIISDNASTDATESICRRYANKDQRIRYIRRDSNIGAAPNFNSLLDLARGKYFRWAAHDDVCAPKYLQECMNIIEHVPNVAIAHSQCAEIDIHGTPKGVYLYDKSFAEKKPAERLKRHLETPHMCTMIFGLMHTDMIKKTPLLEAFLGSDRNLIGELLLQGKVVASSEVLFYRRDHPDTSVHQFVQQQNEKGYVAWFDPEKESDRFTPMIDSIEAYQDAINRSDLSFWDKRRCRKVLSQWCETGNDYLGRNVAELLSTEREMLAKST